MRPEPRRPNSPRGADPSLKLSPAREWGCGRLIREPIDEIPTQSAAVCCWASLDRPSYAAECTVREINLDADIFATNSLCREREQRLSALNAAQQAKEEEIQKKIQQKVRTNGPSRL